jgi:hypothetical protein
MRQHDVKRIFAIPAGDLLDSVKKLKILKGMSHQDYIKNMAHQKRRKLS